MILQPIFDEYWAKGDIIAASEQHRKDVEKTFYVGVWVAMGVLKRAEAAASREEADRSMREMHEETRAKIMPSTLPKFTGHINGERI